MVLIAEGVRNPLYDEVLRSMFEARKRVFVDLLQWDVPVHEGRFELDQFDDPHAVYLIVRGTGGEHLASARLLPTTRPHILDTLFSDLCAGEPPRGPDILEVTRFCLARGLRAERRLEARNCLVSALTDYALARGIATYTGVAELGWLQQILSFGWNCRPLGLPKEHCGKLLGALRIEIGAGTPGLLAGSGVYRRTTLEIIDAKEAA
ncbi:MAG TPA: acyl-homoserine-lactone synthase [Allosphingosinicella sp.]|jgi:acyl-homoserine lactone synthase